MTKVFRRASRCSGYGFLYNSILILALGLLSHSTSPGNKPSPSGGVWSEAQTVKNLPAMQETQVRSLGREDALEKEIATHFSILGLENSMDRGAWQATVHGVAKSWTRLSD